MPGDQISAISVEKWQYIDPVQHWCPTFRIGHSTYFLRYSWKCDEVKIILRPEYLSLFILKGEIISGERVPLTSKVFYF